MTLLAEKTSFQATSEDCVARFRCQGRFGKVEIECTGNRIRRVAFAARSPHSDRSEGVAGGEKWLEELYETMTAYLDGQPVTFDAFPVELDGIPTFWRGALEKCRKIPYGKTTSYQELARKLGNPFAVRAVGSAMSHNPVPIVIPCHRVVRSNGGLGGFSAPEGVNMKRRLLEMERRAKDGAPLPGSSVTSSKYNRTD